MIKRLNRLYGQLLLGLVLLCTASIHAQQTHLLLDPAGAGGFELGTTFEANGWSVVNGTQTNKWELGAVPEWFAGNSGAYISNNGGAGYAYTTTSLSRVHFYRDIAFPTGVENATISLDVSLLGESTWDNVLVYLVDNNVVPSSVGPTSNTLTGWTANISTIASQVTGAVPNTTTLNPEWPNYTYGVTGYYLDAVLRLNTVASSTAVLTNLVINLTQEQVAYVSGNTKRLVITWRNDASGGAQPPGSVDNIKVEAFVPSCYMVDALSSTNVTNSSFDAIWTADLSSLGYKYEVRSSGDPGSGAAGLLQEGVLANNVSTFSIDGLLANTVYKVYVRKICTTQTDLSSWRFLEVKTLCGVTSTFTENFDTSPVGSSTNQIVPDCWAVISETPGSVYVSTSADFESVNGVYMTNGNNTTNDILLVSPQTDNLGNGGYRIRFKARSTTSTLPATSLNVVTLQNQQNTSQMVDVLNIELSNAFQEYVVNLPAGSNDFFAFKHGLSAASRVIYIDEVYYEPIPACSSPAALTVSNLTSNSLTISWSIIPNLEADVNYEYEVRTSGEPGSGDEGLTLTGNVLANAGQVLLTDIPHSTNYTIHLRGNCGVNEIDGWREVSFTTLCGVYTEIEEGFDTTPTGSSSNPSLPLCWSYIDSSAGSLYVNASADYESTNGIYMTNGADVENELILISPETDNLGNGNYRIKFRARTTSSSPTDLQIVTLDNVENTNGINYLEDISLTSVFEEYIVYLPAGTHDFFGFKHGLTATSRVIYIDEIVYEPIPPCPSVIDFEFANSTINSATFNWFVAPGTPVNTNLFYEVRTSGDAGSGATGLVVSGMLPTAAGNGTIEGLADASTYDVYVKTVCDNDGFDFWTQLEIMTACIPVDLVNESFTDVPVGSSTNQTLPTCWRFIDEGVGNGYVSTGSNFSAPRGYQMTNGADLDGNYVLVGPETNNLGNGNYRLRFRAKTTSSSGEELEIFSMANNVGMQGSTLLSTVQLSTSYVEYVVYFPAGTNDFFGLKHGQTGTSRTIYIDDVVFEPIPSCVQVEELNVNINLGQDLINVAWSNPNLPNLANNFEVQYGAAGFAVGSGTSLMVEGLSTNITGFVLNEEYDFYVRRICSDTDKSTWIGPVRVLYNYCTSAPTSNDGLGISQFVLGESTFTIGDVFYENLLGTTVNINSEAPVNSSITFLTGFTYHTHIWIDFNRDGVFDNESELFFSGESSNANPTTLDTTFEINDVYESGVYRMRVGTADSGQLNPNPCYSGSYGVTIDVNVNVSFPCLVPVELEVIEATSNSATLNWEAAGSNFTIEYGPQGFQPGTGTVLTNVNKPYVLTGLNEATRYTFYVKQICLDATTELSEGLNFETLCSTPAPEGEWLQPFVEDDLVSMLNIEGENLKYYLDANMTQEVVSNSVLVEGIYYVTQTLFCESESPLEVLVTLIPRIDEPIVVANQQFCNSAIISDLQVTGLAGATVNWYTTNVGGEPLSANTVLNTGTYYVNQTDGTTTSHRVVVNVVINQVPVDLASTEVLLCGYSSFGAVNVGQEVGAVTKWYASLTSTTPLSNNQQAVTGTYYVTQSFGICESNKVLIEIIAYDALPSPVAAIQTFCGSGTVSQLVAQGVANANLKWYSSSASTVELTGNTQLASGTYYVEQSINGCVSPRKAVAVRVVSMTAPNVEDFYLCGSGTVADLVIYSQSGVTHKWYNSPSSTTELNQNVALSTGLYFVSKVQYGCESNRTPVQVTIGAIPDGPTGIQNQTFIEGSVISDLSLDQDNVVWYISYNDSQTGNNPLESEMPLVNGTTYYAVIIGENGCPSLPLPVVVDVYLSNNDFVKDELKYYPNPVSDLLTITYSDRITQIEVYDLLGKLVKSKQTDDKEINIDLSDLSSGTYMVQLKTDSKQQFIKVVKK